jgi:hypothetical protein
MFQTILNGFPKSYVADLRKDTFAAACDLKIQIDSSNDQLLKALFFVQCRKIALSNKPAVLQFGGNRSKCQTAIWPNRVSEILTDTAFPMAVATGQDTWALLFGTFRVTYLLRI